MGADARDAAIAAAAAAGKQRADIARQQVLSQGYSAFVANKVAQEMANMPSPTGSNADARDRSATSIAQKYNVAALLPIAIQAEKQQQFLSQSPSTTPIANQLASAPLISKPGTGSNADVRANSAVVGVDQILGTANKIQQMSGGNPANLAGAMNQFNQQAVASQDSGSLLSGLGSLYSGLGTGALPLTALVGAGAMGMFGAGAAGAGTSGAIGAGGQLLSSAAPIMMNPATGSFLTAAELAAAPGAIGTAGMLTQTTQALANVGITPQQVAANQNNPSWLQSVSQATGLSPSMLGTVASTGLNMLGSYAQGQAATGAAQTSADAQIRAAQIAADAAKFRPVGVSSRFGQSQFGYDAAGNLTSAGYQLSPEAKAQQDALMGMSNQMLTQYQGAPVATAPMGQAAQTMFGLGQGYLQTSPQAQAQQYMSEQQALLAPGRERELAQLQAQMQAQGRGGLAMGGTSTGMQAANPQLEAYYNAKRMQDLQLAAQATQGGQQYAQFGAGMVGAGGDMLKGMYGTQQAAYAPYQTALGGAVGMEQLGQQPMDIGTAIGAKTSTAAAQGGMLQGQGMVNAAQTMQPANAYSPWGAMLSGAGKAVGQYNQPSGTGLPAQRILTPEQQAAANAYNTANFGQWAGNTYAPYNPNPWGA